MPPREVLRILTEEDSIHALGLVVADLYGEWRVIAEREYPSLAIGPREAAFAVVVWELSRKPMADPDLQLVASARTKVLAALKRQRTRESNTDGAFATRCSQWIPRELEFPLGHGSTRRKTSALEIVTALQRGPGEDPSLWGGVLRGIGERLRSESRKRFARLDRTRRLDALQDALLRLALPLTRATLTPANLAYCVHQVAMTALTAAETQQKSDLQRLVSGVSFDGVACDLPGSEERIDHEFAARLQAALVDEAFREIPWLRRYWEDDEPLDTIVSDERLTSYEAAAAASSRVDRFINRVFASITSSASSRGTWNIREAAEEARARTRVSLALMSRVVARLEAIVSSDAVRMLLPVAVLKAIDRMRDDFRRLTRRGPGGPGSAAGAS